MKTIKKISMFVFTAVFCSLIYFSVPIHVQASAPLISSSVEITPRADDIRWRYTEANGKVYRRLFNYTKDCWVGDWELIG